MMEPARFWIIRNLAMAAKVDHLPIGMLDAPIVRYESEGGKRMAKMSFKLGPHSIYVVTVTADPSRHYAIENVEVKGEPRHYVDEFGDWQWVN